MNSDHVSAQLPTSQGDFQIFAYETDSTNDRPTVVLVKGNLQGKRNVLVRFHSECLTGDLFSSLRCDCGPQLQKSIQMIEKAGSGAILYLRQEGRGIGLMNKLRAYRLQEQGYDTVEANLALQLPADAREYGICKMILDDLGVQSVRLITNNPDKIKQAVTIGIQVEERVPIEITPVKENSQYLHIKKVKMGHILNKV